MPFNMKGFDINPKSNLEKLSFKEVLLNIDPLLLYQNYIKDTFHPDERYKYSTLEEIGVDIFRWMREPQIRLIAINSPEFGRFQKNYEDDNYEQTINACRAARMLRGRDGNVIGHPIELLNFAKINHPEWFIDPVMAKIWELIILFHDIAEFLLMKNGRPAICDFVTDTKTQEDRLWELKTITQIINSLPINSQPLKNYIISVCNKEGSIGKKLGQLEHDLFVFSCLNSEDKIEKIRELGSLKFVNTQDKIQKIRGNTLNNIIEYTTAINTDCLSNERETRNSRFQQGLIDQRNIGTNNVIYTNKFQKPNT